jgi:hypothetical protein
MDLESRVKAYAEEARRILLQRALEEQGQKGGKAFWQGYTNNGNGVVRQQDGKYKVVKVIGNTVLPKESVVYIDEQNTVEVGFRKELPMARGQSKQQLKPTVADKIKRPLILFVEEEVDEFGWFVWSHNEMRYYNIHNNPSGFDDGLSGEGSFTDSITQNLADRVDPIPPETNWSHIVGCAYLYASNPVGFTGNESATVSLTGTPFDITATSTSANNVTDRRSASGLFAAPDQLSATINASISANPFNTGSVSWDATWMWYRSPSTKYFINFGRSDKWYEQLAHKIDIQDYFNDVVIHHRLYRRFIRRIKLNAGGYRTEMYMFIYAITCDFSYEERYDDTSTPGVTHVEQERAYFGLLKHYWLHLKINLETGQVVENSKTQCTEDRVGNSYDGTIYDPGTYLRIGRDIFAYTRTETFYNRATVYQHHYPTNADRPPLQVGIDGLLEGDWMREWSYLDWSTYPWFNYSLFIDDVAFINGTWYQSMNSDWDAPFRIWTPDPDLDPEWANGVPPSEHTEGHLALYALRTRLVNDGQFYYHNQYFTATAPSSISDPLYFGPKIWDQMVQVSTLYGLPDLPGNPEAVLFSESTYAFLIEEPEPQ